MKNHQKCLSLVLLAVLLLPALSACGSRVRFVAPEIDPPADLIPGYVPEGFELISGFQINVPEFKRVFISSDRTGLGICGNMFAPPFITYFMTLKSPVSNEVLGVHYQKGDQILLITKSYFPEGTLDLWRSHFEAPYSDDCECDCGCCQCASLSLHGFIASRLRYGGITEVRTVHATDVAIFAMSEDKTITVFVRDDYLITIAGPVSLEENLEIVASLLEG